MRGQGVAAKGFAGDACAGANLVRSTFPTQFVPTRQITALKKLEPAEQSQSLQSPKIVSRLLLTITRFCIAMLQMSSSRSLSTVLVSENLGVAFACVIGAALATCVGAAAVFFPRLVKLANRKILAGSLSFAAGVMIYVSFLDIFAKAYDGFTEAGNDHAIAYLYSTLTFFGGSAIVLIYQIIDKNFFHAGEEEHDQMERIIAENEQDQQAEVHVEPQETSGEEKMKQTMHSDDSTDSKYSISQSGTAIVSESEKKSLYRMGAKTAIAISFHNFPEGLATFVGYVADPAIGASLAIASTYFSIFYS